MSSMGMLPAVLIIDSSPTEPSPAAVQLPIASTGMRAQRVAGFTGILSQSLEREFRCTYSRSMPSIRACQPAPVALKYATTSGLYRMETRSFLIGIFFTGFDTDRDLALVGAAQTVRRLPSPSRS
jgi:hypothetical protein